jgi:predicted DNA-binding protein
LDKEKATKKFTIRMTETLERRIQDRAQEESRTSSSLITYAIVKYLDEVDNAKRLLNK